MNLLVQIRDIEIGGRSNEMAHGSVVKAVRKRLPTELIKSDWWE
jgi:hypothetical protein